MSNTTKHWLNKAGSGDGSTVLELKDGQIKDLTRFGLRARTGQVRVFGSLDGTNYPTSPLVLSLEPAVDGSDNVTETQGTFVAMTTGTRLHWFFGVYKSLKFLQKGATAVALDVMGSEA